MENKEKEKYVLVQTKISSWAFKRLDKLSAKKGMSIYEVLQLVCDTLLRYMDDKHNLTAEMEKAMSIFEHMDGWAKALNLADPTVQKKIGEATYFIYDLEGNKKGCRAVHVKTPYFGDWEETINLQDILERTICLLMPERYARLRKLAVDKNCSSILELIDMLIDEHSQDEDIAFFREAFEDANRSEYGRMPWQQPFKRRHHKDPYFQELNFNQIDDENESIDNEDRDGEGQQGREESTGEE